MKNILITGARSGIGLDVAKRLLERGHTVFATVHHQSSVVSLQSELAVYGERAIVEKLDILDDEDRLKVQDWDIDILINNAAIGDSGPLSTIPAQRVKDVLETNVVATLQLTQQVLLKMRERRRGRIIFISSLAGLIPTPFISPYALTKHAIENIAGSLRGELKSFGIDVSLINPGGYNTGFNEKNIQKKYEWLDIEQLDPLEQRRMKREESIIYTFEMKSTASIAKQIVKAVEARHPKRRYSAPFWQSWGVFFIRMFS
ncbi:MAG: SDR family NAD(P)-dependent oxidoreductase [Gammaproteobacteria bacterium]|nr:SDR family NAD(P)-dependent oxidoreductase [Gammaproteobacteria bacterium]